MEENKVYRFEEVEELISEMDDHDIPEDEVDADEDLKLVVSGWCIRLLDLGIVLRTGVACVPDEETGVYMPDFDVTVVYENELDAEKWIYYEQDGMLVTVGNFYHGRLSMDEIFDLKCQLVIPNKEDQ